ncbi:MAG: peptide/nickel transport system substrate-binding protein [Frankiales bacterium]|jgi:peptide/nickel transport system substrate-binding protein|nr:peptide/nickel transport system substrate-binding protein [Frankiales bacterium]
MTKPNALRLVAVAAAIGTIALTGCSAAKQPAASVASAASQLNLAYLADMSTPDPDVFYDLEGDTVTQSVYEGLLRYAPNSTTLTPQLATAWTVSTDGLTYTFTIRSGVKFQDGTPLDAQAVITSFRRRLAVNAGPAYMLAPVSTMTATNPTTLVLKLKYRVRPFLDYLASVWGPKIISPKALADNAGTDHDQAWLSAHAVGTGPYQLTGFSKGSQYQLTRFDGYWGTAAKYKTVSIRILPDMNSQLLQLQSGDLDAVLHSFPASQLPTVTANKSLAVHEYPSFLTSLLYINTHKAPFDNLALRQQVAAAINRDQLVQETYGQYGHAATSAYPPGLLTGATAPVSYPASTIKVSGSPKITLAYTAEESGVQQRLADLMQQRLQAAGFQVTLQKVQLPVVYDYAKHLSTAPDLLIETNIPDAASPDAWARLLWSSTGGGNFLGYANPQVDKLIDKGRSAATDAEAATSYAAAAQVVSSDVGMVFLANVDDVMVTKASLTGLQHEPNYPWALDLAPLGPS